MKLIKLIMVISALLFVNLSASIISGYAYCDLNGDGVKDDNETCTQEDIWAKLIDQTNPNNLHVIVQGTLYEFNSTQSGYYEFDTKSKTGEFRVIIDNNDNAKDTIASPPANVYFVSDPTGNISDGNLSNGQAIYTITETNETYTDQNYGMQWGGQCQCEDADGDMIKQTMNVDGNISEWSSVYSDPDNNVCDYGCSKDKDHKIQSTGRNLVQFTWTGDTTHAYGFTFRVGSSSNTQVFFYYTDRDGDGFIGDGMDVNGTWLPDFALVAGWQGSNGSVTFYKYDYIPDPDSTVTDPDGNPADSMLWTAEDIANGKTAPGGQEPDSSWIGSGDGYTLAGKLDIKSGVDIADLGVYPLNGAAEGVTTEKGEVGDAGVKMEWGVRWDFLNLKPFQDITYHISVSNAAANNNNPPSQIDENMAGCYGIPKHICGVTLVPDRSITLSTTEAATVGYVYFEHNLTNTGNRDDNLTLTLNPISGDFTPTSITFYNDTNGDGNASGEPVLSSPVAIGLGESINLLVEVGLPAGLDDNNTVFEINATTTSCDVNPSAAVTDTIIISPLDIDLGIIKEVSDDNATWVDSITRNEGEPAFYKITVKNWGSDDAINVIVTDELPDGVTYVSHSATAGDYNDITDTWTVGGLAKDAEAELIIAVTVDLNAGEIAGKVIQNIACTTSDTNTTAGEYPDCDDANITAMHLAIVDMQISKVVGNHIPYETAENNYTIRIKNNGPDTAYNVIVHDILPPYANYTSSSTAIGDYNETTGDWVIGQPMDIGDAAALIIYFTVESNATANNPHVNTACVTTETNDTNPLNNCSEATFNATNLVDVSVVKNVDVSYPGEGDTIEYTIEVTNHGPIKVTGLKINEDAIAWANITTEIPSHGTYSDPIWNIGDLDVNETATLTLAGTVNTGTAGNSYTNFVSITSLDQNDTNSSNNNADATITVEDPSIDVEKSTNGVDADTSATAPFIPVGDPVTWDYNVTNTGDVNLSNIIVTDDREGPICIIPTLAAGTSTTCTASGTATTVGLYENNATVTGTSPALHDVTDSDLSHYYGEASGIVIEKSTNGEDADATPGPYIPVGAAVNWTYDVNNTGNVDLVNIVVTDDREGTICTIPTLAAGTSTTCSASGTATTTGQYANLGTATGTTPSGASISDNDPSHYYGEASGIVIQKSTNGEDADAAPGPYIPVGAAVNWTYDVNNTGNVDLVNIVVTDDREGTICTIPTLAAGTSTTCSASGTATTTGQYANLGTATGTTPSGASISDNDPSHYYGEASGIVIQKSTNGEDADAAPGPYILVGAAVNWTYDVNNTGNVDLVNIIVTDDREGTICTIPTLAAGTSTTCTATGTAVANQYANIGTAAGTTPSGASINDNDPSHYYGEDASIDIEKSTNDEDADTGTGPEVLPGSTVTWEYVITNNSNVDLTDINVTDDREGAICTARALAAGASMTCTATGTAIDGQYANLGTVTATAPSEATVTDSDPSHYFGDPNCICEDIKSDSSPAMGRTVGALMILMTLMIGLFFVRREEQLNRNER